MIREKSPGSLHPQYDQSFSTPEEWLQYSQNRGILVEELYKRLDWRNVIHHADTTELRKKLLTLSPEDLAKILVKLDHP
jgi:hypothetical protein